MSCCTADFGATNSTECNEKSTTLRNTGCVDAFGSYIKDHAVSLGAVGVGLAVVQFAGIFLACYIARQIKMKTGHTGFN